MSSKPTRLKKQTKRWSMDQVDGLGKILLLLWVNPLSWSSLGIRGSKGDAVLNSGCTYSLMNCSLWNSVKKEREVLCPSEIPRFVKANGQKNRAIGKATLLLALHNFRGTLAIHVLDNEMCMPLMLGLNFMILSQMVLMPHLMKYIIPGENEYKSWPGHALVDSSHAFFCCQKSPRSSCL